jgi:hypothetical protein
LSESRTGSRGNVNSSVRGIFGGGRNPLVLSVSTIDYITITSTGNAVFFGDLTKDRQGAAFRLSRWSRRFLMTHKYLKLI